jgi:hypothetical protein
MSIFSYTALPVIILLVTGSCRKDDDPSEIPADTGISEILSRPTNSSVTINVLTSTDAEIFFEYGKTPENYLHTTETLNVTGNVPVEALITNLEPDAKFYYRLRSRAKGSSADFIKGQGHSFQTQRSKGSIFSFAIEADPHLDTNSDTAAYNLTLKNISTSEPDFLLDLGDTFMSEKQPSKTQSDVTARHILLRSYFDNICHSVPLYLVIGNHEGENGWDNDGSGSSLPVMASNTRKLYFSNPLPDQFYSGNEREEAYVGRRQDYYSFEWGDALFIVLDPFWYTTNKSEWGYTLGKAQYDWFNKVITGSTSKFKFIFIHNLVGGYTKDARGGAEYADFYEMGGKNPDGSWGFDNYRPGWGKPLHTLMKENNVTALFHGHDHFYGKQEKDGIIYQEVPQPSNRNITNLSASDYGYVNGKFLAGRGYVLVTVSPDEVKVEYKGSFLTSEETGSNRNNNTIDTYTIK